jgi:hypothetical protein
MHEHPKRITFDRLEPAPARAREALEPRRVPEDDGVIGYISGDHRSGSNHREAPDADTGEHHRAAAYGGPVPHDGFSHCPVAA